MRELTELIDQQSSGWLMVQQWLKEANNNYEVLPCDPTLARSALHQLQVTTLSPLGAVLYETGGILVDNGWLRILGSGHPKLARAPASWTQSVATGRIFQALLVADDVSGAFLHLTVVNSVKIEAAYIISHRILWNGRALILTIQVSCNGFSVAIWIDSIKAYAGQAGVKKHLK